MLWMALAIVAAILWSIGSIFEKHIITYELRDIRLDTVITKTTIVALFIAVALIFGTIGPFNVYLVLGGIVTAIGSYFLFYSLKKEEASRVIPLAMIGPLFVIILAFLFLNETFTIIEYSAMLAIVAGSIIISLEKAKKKLIFAHALIFAVIAAILFAVRDVFFKFGVSDIFSSIFWFAIGALLVHAIVFIWHHPHIIKKARKGVRHLIIIGFVNGVAFLLYLIAVSTGPVSIVSSLATLEAVFVFILATTLSFFHSKIIVEKLDRTDMIIKISGILLIIAGVVGIVL